MTKAELLADLAGRDFIAWVGTPSKVKDDADGFAYYTVRVGERVGNVGTFHQVTFFVWNDGGQDELAYYQGQDPFQTSIMSEFRRWIYGVYAANPQNFKGLVIHRIDEIAKSCIYTILEGTPLTQHTYFVIMGQAPVAISNFNPSLLGGVNLENI